MTLVVPGKCPESYPNCKGMKELWKHIAACRKQQCNVSCHPHPRCF
jgi:hypothetical protein